MATATTVALTTELRGEYSVPKLSDASASKASTVLSENHEENDIITNDLGHHNHIVHHILTAYALGATSDVIQERYDRNACMQRRPPPTDAKVIEELSNTETFLAHLRVNNIRHYNNYLQFFQNEIQAKGYRSVVDEYVFKGHERANKMFARLFSGTLHPLIHLGFGIEFQQPAIVAEALAQTCIHPTWLDSFLLETDKASKDTGYPSKALLTLLDEVREDKKLSTAARWTDRNLIFEGVLSRARTEMFNYCIQWKVKSDQIEAAEAEIANAAAYYAGCAQRPPKQIKFDFWMIHEVTSSVLLAALVRQDWISAANKAKLLEYKGRIDLVQYAARRAPKLLLDEVVNYAPKRPDASDWASVIERSNQINDDGHSCKLVRALAHGEQICKPWENSDRFRMKSPSWLQFANMAIDSVEITDNRWIRNAGFEEAWEGCVDRASL